MKHVFIIKDLIATSESASNVIQNEIEVLLKAVTDIEISEIGVFYNDFSVKEYDEYVSKDIPVHFIPVLNSNKKIEKKLTFAGFHNYVVNSIAKYFSMEDVIVHIIDGTLEISDGKSEQNKCNTRIAEMIIDVVEMMKLLNHPVWFNTASDKGNYKFGHYYTNVDLINIDKNCPLESCPECIMYSNNTNLDWIIIDSNNYNLKTMPNLMMNSQYEYDFLSIKELVAKFANAKLGYFVTMLPTVPTEVGAYSRNKKLDKDFQDYDMTNYKDNMKIYKENLKQYEGLAQSNLATVLEFVKNTVTDKLTDNDRLKIVEFSESL